MSIKVTYEVTVDLDDEHDEGPIPTEQDVSDACLIGLTEEFRITGISVERH